MRATDNHLPLVVAAHVLSDQFVSGMRSAAGGVILPVPNPICCNDLGCHSQQQHDLRIAAECEFVILIPSSSDSSSQSHEIVRTH
jgi:hypothetical protein